MASALLGRDIFLRHTATNGTSYVQTHRVWDAERFVAAQERAAADLNVAALKEDPPAPARAKAEQITEDQFHNERKTR
jgi:hypothetical protein